jgi:hypothetical protein
MNDIDGREWINVDANGTDGTGPALASVLRSIASTLEESPSGYRYDFEIVVDETPREQEADR